MSSLDEKIARAQAAQSARPIHKDLVVSLDASLSDERAALLKQIGVLNAEREVIVQSVEGTLALAPDTAAIDKRLNTIAGKLKKLDTLDKDSLITIRLYRVKGDEWLDLKTACPPRLNAAIDRGVGYNVNTLTVAALAGSGRILDGDTEVEKTQDEWTVLAGLLSGGDFERLADFVYQINVADSLARTEALKNS